VIIVGNLTFRFTNLEIDFWNNIIIAANDNAAG